MWIFFNLIDIIDPDLDIGSISQKLQPDALDPVIWTTTYFHELRILQFIHQTNN